MAASSPGAAGPDPGAADPSTPPRAHRRRPASAASGVSALVGRGLVVLALLWLAPQPVLRPIAEAFRAAQAATAAEDYPAAADVLSEAAARLPYDATLNHRAG